MDDRGQVRGRGRGAPHALQLIAFLAGCGTSTPAGRLLWVAERGGVAQVWTADADGADPRPLADLPGTAFPAAPDPLGTHALLVTAEDDARGHREQLWLAPLDGGTAAPFGPRTERIRNPAWSPDGRTVVFEADLESFRDIWAIGRDGTGLRRLTVTEHGSFEPSISATRLAFGTSRDGNAEIYAAAPDGSAPVRLTDDVADDVRPVWSPDGSRLAWISHRGGTARVWTMAPDGTDARPLRAAAEKAMDLDLAWAPDGGRLAVVVQTGAREVDIDLVDADGRVVARLGGPGVDEQPAWSPDGRWLVYAAAGELVRVDRDGGGARPLTADPAPDWLPRWVGQKQ